MRSSYSRCAALRVERFLALHFARQVLAISEAVASQLHRSNVLVVHEEADLSEFNPGRAGRAREALGLPDRALTVGFVGRIDTWKGIDVLLESVPLLRAGPAGTGGRRGMRRDRRRHGRRQGGLRRRPAPASGRLRRALARPSTRSSGGGPDRRPGLPGTALDRAGTMGPRTGRGAGVRHPGSGDRRRRGAEILAGLPPEAGRLVPPRDAAALAGAIAALLPASTSSELRRARRVLRAGKPAPYVEIFEAAMAAQARCLPGGRQTVDKRTRPAPRSRRLVHLSTCLPRL